MPGGEVYERVREVVLRLSPTWEQRMGISHYKVEHVFLESEFGEEAGDDFRITATAETRWNYMLAKVKWYLPSACRHDEATLEDVLVHELCHVLLAAEQDLLNVEIERVHAERAGTSEDFNVVQALYHERMEMATEMTARSLLIAWRRQATVPN